MATVKKLTSTSNGNEVFVTDLVNIDTSDSSILGALPCNYQSLSPNITPVINCTMIGADPQIYSVPVISPITLHINTGNMVVAKQGDVYKVFGTSQDLTVSQGQYLYGIGTAYNYQQRTSSTGATYYPYVEYKLQVSSTPITTTPTTDLSLATGTWLLIDGSYIDSFATTAAWSSLIRNIYNPFNEYVADYRNHGELTKAATMDFGGGYIDPNMLGTLLIQPIHTMNDPLICTLTVSDTLVSYLTTATDIYKCMVVIMPALSGGTLRIVDQVGTKDYALSSTYKTAFTLYFTNKNTAAVPKIGVTALVSLQPY